MSAAARIVAYGAALLVVLAAAVGVGRWVGPVETGADNASHEGGGHADGERVHVEPAEGDHAGHDSPAGPEEGAVADTYRLALEQPIVDAGRAQVGFRILDPGGDPVRSYDVVHEKRLHLIAVRRDLAGFRHVHPRLEPGTGRWTVPLDLGAGSWRLYADFAPAGQDPALAEAELMVAGRFQPRPLGPDSATGRVDDYEVHLAREGAMLTLHVTRGGDEVTDLQPYLGAYGHLVAIRADDMSYLHVHPEDGAAGPEVAFHAEFAEPGRYRLFLDFRHRGAVRTASFTLTVGSGDADGDEAQDNHEDQDDGDHEH